MNTSTTDFGRTLEGTMSSRGAGYPKSNMSTKSPHLRDWLKDRLNGVVVNNHAEAEESNVDTSENNGIFMNILFKKLQTANRHSL